jgi:hypothetical protein
MLVVSENYQNYKNGAVSNQLTDIGSRDVSCVAIESAKGAPVDSLIMSLPLDRCGTSLYHGKYK